MHVPQTGPIVDRHRLDGQFLSPLLAECYFRPQLLVCPKSPQSPALPLRFHGLYASSSDVSSDTTRRSVVCVRFTSVSRIEYLTVNSPVAFTTPME